MKINPAAARGIYRTNLAGYKSALSAQDPEQSGKLSGNTDHISISQSGARQLRRESEQEHFGRHQYAGLSRSVWHNCASGVQNGTYYIPTDRLTGVLMQRWFGL
ncbi:hypothetical protein [Neglectibacter timonensis]|uniref:hypothetical protein n=1 Tax=Neglectibacter timonensis TaxID=1776382 RepID=UPI003993CBA0